MSRTWKLNPSRKYPGWLVVLGPFDQGFVDAIKARIHKSLRTWDPVIKAWRIHEDVRAELEQIIEEYSEP